MKKQNLHKGYTKYQQRFYGDYFLNLTCKVT